VSDSGQQPGVALAVTARDGRVLLVHRRFHYTTTTRQHANAGGSWSHYAGGGDHQA
jgi:hypothetical protein